MRCPVHCPPASGALRGPLLALGAFAALAVAVWLLALAAPFLAAAVVVCAVLAYPAVRVLRWTGRLALASPGTVAIVVRHGGLPAPRWPDRPALGALPLAVEAGLVRAPYQLPAGPLAVTDGRERAPAVVPGASSERLSTSAEPLRPDGEPRPGGEGGEQAGGGDRGVQARGQHEGNPS